MTTSQSCTAISGRRRSRLRRAHNLVTGMAAVAFVLFAANGCSSADTKAVSGSSVATSTTKVASSTGHISLTEFAAAADAVCIAIFPKVDALEDPDGEGGNKPLGLGRVVRGWADDLAAITAPDAIADDWVKATALLRRSGVRLEDAERLAGDGDPRSGAAQSEALWSLQPRAAKIIAGLEIPFKACFVE
jgi:hypothetical protein